MTSGPISVAATHKALAADSRRALVDALESAGGPLDAAQAARLVGLHRNTARVHLEQLSEAGLVERSSEDRARPGRPRVLYASISAPAPTAHREDGPAGGAADYRELARVLAAQLSATSDPAAEAVRAGRRWSTALSGVDLPTDRIDAESAVEKVTEIMGSLGFRPVADERRILLRRCPFQELAREQREVVCGVHLGMLEQTFDALDSPVAVRRLDPLVQHDPLLCVVHLTEQHR